MFKKASLLCLLISVLFSLALILCFILDHQLISGQIELTNAQMENSTENWNRINEEKLVLQQDLKLLNEQLRDAEMTLDESTERIDELSEEIATLKNDISDLNRQLEQYGNE